ncbi:Zinc-type alcohol dehydrogenase-like protein-like protein [Hapsidospora chrysogenum ATCC 11550]|uniref:Zinc-type alcohol dehydrogenase-like protein-like protein n=1 Tax=Hapsidospora chrysogenum (strain ATCC 11550 / CBS 779.69 / DSM 880 / IAM 14645 / JCM 23072 / IMI 49137) TaxID=857340 RepID=A0A086SXA1_HAPC1|nr:Zinc-type alcohol dehydrogenase-like protein-like protein [Hapsidospora chrysogenum ATCC 11550]
MAYTGKAWQYTAIASKLEDALSINENAPLVDPSSLRPDQVIVEVISASINPVDYKLPEAPALGRILVPRPATPGLDLCGRIVATHPSSPDNAGGLREGQLVFGGIPSSVGTRGMGTLRRYAVLPTSGLAPLPEGVDPDHAAAVGTAGSSAYLSLMPETLPPDANIFINGGSGGVGTWAVQLAKAMGAAHVVATCSTGNVALCQQLGADEVIDYRTVDVMDYLRHKGPVFDLIVDNVGAGTELYDVSRQVLKPGGTFVQVGVSEMSAATVASMVKRNIWPSFLGAPKYRFISMDNDAAIFRQIGEWMADRRVKAVIDRTFAWEGVPQAYRYLREGHAKGKVVIKVGE